MSVHADEHSRNQILAQGQTTPGTSLLDKKAWIGQKINQLRHRPRRFVTLPQNPVLSRAKGKDFSKVREHKRVL